MLTTTLFFAFIVWLFLLFSWIHNCKANKVIESWLQANNYLPSKDSIRFGWINTAHAKVFASREGGKKVVIELSAGGSWRGTVRETPVCESVVEIRATTIPSQNSFYVRRWLLSTDQQKQVVLFVLLLIICLLILVATGNQ